MGGRVVREILKHPATRQDTSRLDPLPGFGGGVQGSVIFRTHDRWVWIGPGTDNQVLGSQGADKDARWVTLALTDISVISVGVSKTSDQTISDATWTAITWNNTRWDPTDMHDSGGNTERLTIATAGLYYVEAHVVFNQHATGYRYILLREGIASTRDQTEYANPDGSLASNMHIGRVLNLAVDEYLAIDVLQTSGGDLDIKWQSNQSTYFQATYLGPTP